MQKIIYYLKNAVYMLIIIILGLLLIDEEPFPFFIFSLWLLLISISLYKDKIFLLKILIPDFKINKHRETENVREKQIKIYFFFSLILFVFGIVELLT